MKTIPTFAKILKNNNIIVPEGKIERFFFDLKWNGAEKEYAKLLKEYVDRKFEWSMLRSKFEFEEWEEEFPTFEEIVIFNFSDLKFTSPAEAKVIIRDAYYYMVYTIPGRMKQKAYETTEFARGQWIHKLSTSVRFGDMIILQHRRFKPSEEDKELIDLAVRNCHECAVWGPEWRVKMICFPGFKHMEIPKRQFEEFTPRDTIVILNSGRI